MKKLSLCQIHVHRLEDLSAQFQECLGAKGWARDNEVGWTERNRTDSRDWDPWSLDSKCSARSTPFSETNCSNRRGRKISCLQFGQRGSILKLWLSTVCLAAGADDTEEQHYHIFLKLNLCTKNLPHPFHRTPWLIIMEMLYFCTVHVWFSTQELQPSLISLFKAFLQLPLPYSHFWDVKRWGTLRCYSSLWGSGG